MSLARRTTVGVVWKFVEQISRQGLSVGVTLLLAIYLTPADFGLVAMMAVFLAIAGILMESGFKEALIRMRDATQVDFNAAFYANLALGALSYALLFAGAPWIADFYANPGLIPLVRTAALGIVINSFQVVQSAALVRELNFRLQLKATLPASLASGALAVGLANLGFGVWALVGQMLLSALITTLLFWRLQGWRPSWQFCASSLARMYRFGYKLFLSGLLDAVFKNIYVVVIAKLFSPTTAGLYVFAEKIKELVLIQLVSSIQAVTYPALAALQDDDQRLKEAYRKIVVITTFIVFPVLIFLTAFSQPLFEALLPEKWQAAIPYLQMMCIAALLYPLHAINLNVLKVKGRSDLFLYLEIGKKLLVVVILSVSVQYGIYGILTGQIVGSVLAYVPNAYFSAKLINYPISQQVVDFLPCLGLSLGVGSLGYFATQFVDWQAWLELLVFGPLVLAAYAASAHLLKLRAFELLVEMARDRVVSTKGG